MPNTPLHASARSASTARTPTTIAPSSRARAASSSASRVFPVPASPSTTTTPPPPVPPRGVDTPGDAAGRPLRVMCRGQVPVGEELLRPAYQHLFRAPAPVLALRSQPRLELGGARYAEPLEEFPMHEVRRTG